MLRAFERSAPSVRFVSLAIFLTGVRAFECARNSLSSALVYSRRTRFFAFLAPQHAPDMRRRVSSTAAQFVYDQSKFPRQSRGLI